jgi:hypothetical protein
MSNRRSSALRNDHLRGRLARDISIVTVAIPSEYFHWKEEILNFKECRLGIGCEDGMTIHPRASRSLCMTTHQTHSRDSPQPPLQPDTE